MYGNYGVDMVRSFKFLATLYNGNEDVEKELARKITKLEKLLYRSNMTDKALDKATEDIIRCFRDIDLGKEAYQIVRDAISSNNIAMSKIEMALENINESINSINKKDDIMLGAVGLSNPTSKAMVEINDTLGRINRSLKDLIISKTKSETSKVSR